MDIEEKVASGKANFLQAFRDSLVKSNTPWLYYRLKVSPQYNARRNVKLEFFNVAVDMVEGEVNNLLHILILKVLVESRATNNAIA